MAPSLMRTRAKEAREMVANEAKEAKEAREMVAKELRCHFALT